MGTVYLQLFYGVREMEHNADDLGLLLDLDLPITFTQLERAVNSVGYNKTDKLPAVFIKHMNVHAMENFAACLTKYMTHESWILFYQFDLYYQVWILYYLWILYYQVGFCTINFLTLSQKIKCNGML